MDNNQLVSNHIVSLASSAVLVAVDVNVWSATKQDRGISSEVTTAKKASADAGKFTKNLLANNPHHKGLMNYRQTIYTWLKRSTYDWNQGQQLLPVTDLIKFKQEYNFHEQAFQELLDKFCDNYDSIKTKMAFSQGDMFNIEDYPSVNEVKEKFKCNLYVSEVPEQDFRCSIAQDTADDLRQQHQQQVEGIIHGVVQRQTKEVTQVIKDIAHCCGYSEYKDKNGETVIKKRKIYDKTITKAKELCKAYQEFQPIDSSESKALVEAVVSLEKVLGDVSIEHLKEGEATRAQVKDDLTSILSKFN